MYLPQRSHSGPNDDMLHHMSCWTRQHALHAVHYLRWYLQSHMYTHRSSIYADVACLAGW
jgi:hypothetical protein